MEPIGADWPGPDAQQKAVADRDGVSGRPFLESGTNRGLLSKIDTQTLNGAFRQKA